LADLDPVEWSAQRETLGKGSTQNRCKKIWEAVPLSEKLVPPYGILLIASRELKESRKEHESWHFSESTG